MAKKNDDGYGRTYILHSIYIFFQYTPSGALVVYNR